MFVLDYVPESVFEAILTSILEERFPEKKLDFVLFLGTFALKLSIKLDRTFLTTKNSYNAITAAYSF